MENIFLALLIMWTPLVFFPYIYQHVNAELLQITLYPLELMDLMFLQDVFIRNDAFVVTFCINFLLRSKLSDDLRRQEGQKVSPHPI